MNRILLVLAAALLALPILMASAAIPETPAVTKGVSFVRSKFQLDGSYGATSAGQNFDAIYAVRAAGYNPARDHTDTNDSPVTWLAANAAAQTKPASAAKAALAAKAIGADPKAVNGIDLIARITSALDAKTGKYADDDFSQSVAMLGLACTGNTVAATAPAALKATQLKDGGWGFDGASDPDTTAIALQALLAAGTPKTDAAITKAITYIKTTQLPDGGWGFAPDSNASSTAFVVQALIAAGESLDIPVHITAGPSPTSYLLSQQNADGSFKGYDVAFSTNQVVPALAGRTFCNAADTPITRDSGAGPLLTHATPSVPPATPAPTLAAPGAPRTGSGESPTSSSLPLLTFAASLLAAAAAATTLSLRRRR